MKWLLIPLLFVCLIPVSDAFAYTKQFCFEDVNDLCGIASGDVTQIFGGIMEPLESQVPGFAMIIFWGGIFAILWFKTENIMLLGLVGIFVNATIVVGVPGTIGISPTAQGIGLLLLGVANGLLIFQLLRQRIVLFS